jgi:hypothetical protein
MVSLISSSASICSTAGGRSSRRNCVSCMCNVTMECAMTLEPSVSTGTLCIAPADMHFGDRYVVR